MSDSGRDPATGPDTRIGGSNAGSGNGRGPALPVQSDVPAVKLIGTLAIAGALAGMLIVTVFQWTQPRVLAHQTLVLGEAIREVLHDPDHYQTLFVVDGTLTADLAGQDSTGLDRVYLGFDASGTPTGFAIVGAEPGFQDVIQLIFGYDAGRHRLLGMKVLESKETPGLGDRIEKDTTFAAGFAGVLTPIRGVKKGAGTDKDDEVDMITGATISSRAVIAIINHRLEQIGPLLEKYHTGVTQ